MIFKNIIKRKKQPIFLKDNKHLLTMVKIPHKVDTSKFKFIEY